MRRFTIAADRLEGERVTFDREETHHLARVLRLRPGDTVIATDGTGRELTVRIASLGEPAWGIAVGVADGPPESPVPITLVQGVPKGDRMESLLRAATELGAARIVPVVTQRTVVRLDVARWRERARRWQRVVREASKQCRRAVIPVVEPPRPLQDWLATLPGPERSELRLCLWEGPAAPLRQALAEGRIVEHVSLLVGPEGGLAPVEVDAARSQGFVVASLGHRVLRTETAGPAVIAVLQWTLGDLGRV